MTKVVGYARVSTKEQNLDRQLKALRQYVPEDMIVTDKASGKDFDRAGYQSLKVGIGKLTEGDTLYVKSIDRLGRNKEETKKELMYFKEHGIRLKIIDLPTTLTDYPEGQEWVLDMVTNILIEVYSTFAEQEREYIKGRSAEGRKAMPTDPVTGKRISKKTGKVVGRPVATIPNDWMIYYNKWKNHEITATFAMESMDIKRTTFYKFVKEYEKKNRD